jgi:hypothetical protein
MRLDKLEVHLFAATSEMEGLLAKKVLVCVYG